MSSTSGISFRNRLRAVAVISAMQFGGVAPAATLYWDTDGSTGGNDVSTGANLGGAGIWSAAHANWWDTSLGTPQAWIDASDAVFWGTAGAVTASTVSANSLA